MKLKIGNKEFEVDDAVVTKAIEDKIDVSIEGTYVVRTEEEEKSFEKNKYEEGRVVGEEKLIRTAKEKFGLNFEGKSIDKFVEAIQTKTLADAKIEPEEKLKKINQTLEEKEKALKLALEEKETLAKSFDGFKSETKINAVLESFIPENVLLPREDIKLLLRNKMKFNTDEFGNVVALDEAGNIIKNPTTADALPVKNVIEDFFKTNQQYLKPIEGGRGKGSGGGTGGEKQTIEEFMAEMEEKNIAPNSSEFNSIATERQKANLLSVE